MALVFHFFRTFWARWAENKESAKRTQPSCSTAPGQLWVRPTRRAQFGALAAARPTSALRQTCSGPSTSRGVVCRQHNNRTVFSTVKQFTTINIYAYYITAAIVHRERRVHKLVRIAYQTKKRKNGNWNHMNIDSSM